MTSRERVLTTFAHQEPDRVPAWCGASPDFIDKAKRELNIVETEQLFVRFGDDFRRVYAKWTGPEPPLSEGATFRTVFGIERQGLGWGQPMSHPLIRATIRDVHEYPWPDPKYIDVSQIRAEALAWNQQYAILGGDWSPFWHDAIDLMGMEELLLAMYDQPELVDALLTHLVDFYFASSQKIFDVAADVIDIFFIGNDFGSQRGPLISADTFQRFFFRHIQRLARLGHDYNLKIMMHCCGSFAALMPAMIEAGLDGLQALQPCGRGMEPESLKQAFGGRLVFSGCIDSHHVLIKGTPDLVRSTTRRVIDTMKPGGGYVLSASHDYLLEETPVENVIAMFDVRREYESGS